MNRHLQTAGRRELFRIALGHSFAAAAVAAAACLPTQSLLAQAGATTGAPAAAGVNPNAPAAQGLDPNAPAAQGNDPRATGFGGRPYFNDNTFQTLGPLATRYGIPNATGIGVGPRGNISPDNLGVDQQANYGYYQDDPNAFIYDYYGYQPYYSYGPAFPTAVPGTGVAPPATYFSYRDSNNDGFFDSYYSSRDADNDGVRDSYELEYARRAAVENQVAKQEAILERQAEREQARDERRAALAANPGVSVDGGLGGKTVRDPELPTFERRTVDGVVVSAKTAKVNNREHTVVQVSADGRTEVIDLGPSDALSLEPILPGTAMVAIGMMQPVGKQKVLFADEATIGDRLVKVDRRDVSQTGTVIEVVRAPVANAEHTIAVVDVDGTRRMVDLGPLTPEKLGVAAETVVAFRGVPIRLGEYPVTMAYEVTIDGKEISLQR